MWIALWFLLFRGTYVVALCDWFGKTTVSVLIFNKWEVSNLQMKGEGNVLLFAFNWESKTRREMSLENNVWKWLLPNGKTSPSFSTFFYVYEVRSTKTMVICWSPCCRSVEPFQTRQRHRTQQAFWSLLPTPSFLGRQSGRIIHKQLEISSEASLSLLKN